MCLHAFTYLHGVDRPAPLEDGVSDGVWDELFDELLDGSAAHVTGDDLGHAGTDFADLQRMKKFPK